MRETNILQRHLQDVIRFTDETFRRSGSDKGLISEDAIKVIRWDVLYARHPSNAGNTPS